jgi:hypothetical protein
MVAAPVFTDEERARVGAALDALVPGAAALGAVDYVERLLSALDHDPPRIWAGRDDAWLELGPWERHAWGLRIAELRAVYRRVVDGEAGPDDQPVLHVHACEAAYGDPADGGNRVGEGWRRIGFPEPLFPPRR